jgi:hypothetical protein
METILIFLFFILIVLVLMMRAAILERFDRLEREIARLHREKGADEPAPPRQGRNRGQYLPRPRNPDFSNVIPIWKNLSARI